MRVIRQLIEVKDYRLNKDKQFQILLLRFLVFIIYTCVTAFEIGLVLHNLITQNDTHTRVANIITILISIVSFLIEVIMIFHLAKLTTFFINYKL